MNAAHANLLLAWVWIFLGFAAGFVLGLAFHREDWLGGYGSFPRRLYRLAHIAFFGTGFVNLAFWLTASRLPADATTTVASWALMVGALTMPPCCALMAQSPKFRLLFGIPVFSLLIGAGATLWQVLHL